MNDILEFLDKNQTIINMLSLPISLIAFFVAFITLIYTIKLFYMKKGIDVRCSYSINSSIECEDSYIGDFILENRKDKSIVIFQIYLKIGHNYYLEIEDFSDNPLVVKPFEVYSKKFDPILFYSVSMKRIKLDNLINERRIKKKIILFTTNGKYEVKAHINLTNPIVLFFRNYLTFVIYPNRLKYEDKAYGSNIKFLVELISKNNEKEILSLRENSYQTKFNGFKLTRESLISKENLETFFDTEIKNNNLKHVEKFNIIDFQKEVIKRKNNQIQENKIIEAKYYNYFKYFILGKFFTVLKNKKLQLKNYLNNDKIGKKISKFIFCR
ncbi:hypothetical protein [Aliarcobacter butzleri]|uniref:hypothetical protein n=1 Tax=Aliarcobacter butzleri TaxID=28197 RepID=UPI0021B2FDA8|nr:hypothetical protein [Aliarcobacter butzleri]MCT7616481.1 hypothetical protein [Aliarcobacter butzleri]MDN5086356.1 hypothetical protein [Aliarcobacter butzleri]